MYEMKLVMTITKDGQEFSKSTQEYANMSYDTMQTAQGTIVRSLVNLGDERMGRDTPQQSLASQSKSNYGDKR